VCPWARPEFDPTWAHVVDARDAVQFELSGDEVRQLAETSVLAPWARRAVVVTDRAIFGFRMYGALFERQVDGSAVGVFRTLDDAIEWSRPDNSRSKVDDDPKIVASADIYSSCALGTRPVTRSDRVRDRYR
jgi:hypothetical protein